MKYNILIAGVGGQGTLLASRVLGAYAMKKGLDCKLSEVHGMAQRGGSVVTYVKMSDGAVNSPIIAEGDTDVLVAFEKLEALRWAYTVKKDGCIIVNNQEIMPLPVIIGSAQYPGDAIDRIKSSRGDITTVDAISLAAECGNVKAVNTVMLGKLAKKIGLDYEVLKDAVAECLPEKIRKINLLALEKSYNS